MHLLLLKQIGDVQKAEIIVENSLIAITLMRYLLEKRFMEKARDLLETAQGPF